MAEEKPQTKSTRRPPKKSATPRRPELSELSVTESGHAGMQGGFEEAIGEAREFVRHRFEVQPWTTALTAVGVGFVLGRGMRSPLTRTLLSAGLRTAVNTAMDQRFGTPHEGGFREGMS